MKITYKKFWDTSLDQYKRKLNSQTEFYKMLITSREVMDFVYLPDLLSPSQKNEYRISGKKFSACSFVKTNFENIEFWNCTFKDCKFNLCKFKNCKFHDCKFTLVNMYKVEVKECYWDADFFNNIIPNFTCLNIAVRSSNVCVSFFQSLYKNAQLAGQEEHKRNADYHFKKWKGLNLLQKKFITLPQTDKIGWPKFLIKFPPNLFLYLFTGYGYRISNFIATFIIGVSFFLYINHANWTSYAMHERDVPLKSFQADSANIRTSIYYTLDATTKLIDSQMQPTSDYGMNWLCVQGIFGCLLLGGLITIILNKFVK